MTNGLDQRRLAMLQDLLDHRLSFRMITGIYTNLDQFMAVKRVINFLHDIFSEPCITYDNDDLEVMGQFTQLLDLGIGK